MPELYDYQRVSVEHLDRNPRAGLFLDMGLGKTAVVLRAIRPEHLPVLVTAPKRVAENVWQEERDLWRPDLSIAIVAGTPRERARKLAEKADITVIGRDNLEDAVAHRDRFNTFIIDELSGFKTRGSNRWSAAQRISVRVKRVYPKKGSRRYRIETSPRIPYVWGMTGTPTPNGLLDLWAQLFLLDGGERLGTTLTAYRKRWFTPGRQLANGAVVDWEPLPGAEAEIYAAIEDICLSMESEGRITLPEVLPPNFVEVPFTPAARAAYKTFKKDLVVNLDMLGGGIHSAGDAAALTGKMAQIVAGFMYPDDPELADAPYDVIHRERARAVAEIVEGTGSPVIVMYQYRAEADLITEALGKGVFTPDTPDLQRRWNAGELPVLLAHPASLGHGLNLQKGPGHTLVWASLPWSLEEYQQTNKRLPRQGQKYPVVTHILETPRTIDRVKFDRLEGKKSVQEALMDHLESPL